jgi:hypothetical protein
MTPPFLFVCGFFRWALPGATGEKLSGEADGGPEEKCFMTRF